MKIPHLNQKRVFTSVKCAMFGAGLSSLILSSVFVLAHAADYDSLADQSSYTIKILDTQSASSSPLLTNSNRIIRTSHSTVNGTLVDSEKRTLRLSNGGVIWVSNDPVALSPKLSVSTSKEVKVIQGEQFKKPITFTLNTNYGAFVKSWEIQVFDDADEDLRNPLVSLTGKGLINGQSVEWDGKINNGHALRAGNRLHYVLTVKGEKGHIDKTAIQSMALHGQSRHLANQGAVSSRDLRSHSALQTIPLQGARVRISGNEIVDHQSLSIDGEKVNVVDNKFIVERILPAGQHNFNLTIKEGQTTHNKQLSTLVDGKYLFMVGLADVTVGEGRITGNLESLSDGDKYLDGDIFVDGRLAFYLKGKILGKYLVTAQMDTGTAEIDELFDNIHKKDPQSVFRRLDPDKYYPVYGDDSTLVDDTNSQGKMYVRVDWDKSTATWGNFNTGMTGTELSAFNRSLYGAKIHHKSTHTTSKGKHRTDLTAFASEAQSAFRHNQFLGTGGSLYYLKDTDIVDGSEKVWVEVRERNGDRVVEQVEMEAGRDYQIDEFQGRIILNRPLQQIAEQANPSLVKDTPLDDNTAYLMVDYEYTPQDFIADKASYGARGKAWLNDHVAVGGTMAHEGRVGNDYDLKGIDVTLEKSKGTYLVAEYAETEALQSQGSFYSADGGLKFDTVDNPTTATNIKGAAYSVEARANLKDVMNGSGSLGAWYKHRDAGFSTARLAQGEETVDMGAEAIVDVSDNIKLSAKATVNDKKDTRKLTTASVQGDIALGRIAMGAELRNVKEEDQRAANNTASVTDGEGTLAAFKVGYDFNDNIDAYLIGQSTLKKSGSYEANDLVTIGTKARLTTKIDLNAELSAGDRGEAATFGFNYAQNNSHKLYSNYTLSKENASTERNLLTLGQRKTVTDRLSVFSEHQFTRETQQHGVGNSLGVDYGLTDDLLVSMSMQAVKLEKDSGGSTDRNAFSVGLNYNKDKTSASSRLEYRLDSGDEIDTEQWVSTNRLNYRVNPSLRVQGKVNYSQTLDNISNTQDAKFIEAGIGFALRPVNNDRLNVLGRVSYLHDLQPLSQSNNPDEKSIIASVEGEYQLGRRWSVGGKLAHKVSEVRSDRAAGNWEKNDATLAAVRARYHLTKNWDALAQYHWMNSDESQDSQQGAMVSLDRHLGQNLKIGVGYNFTKFDDDLGNNDGDAKGWFVNLVGKF